MSLSTMLTLWMAAGARPPASACRPWSSQFSTELVARSIFTTLDSALRSSITSSDMPSNELCQIRNRPVFDVCPGNASLSAHTNSGAGASRSRWMSIMSTFVPPSYMLMSAPIPIERIPWITVTFVASNCATPTAHPRASPS